MSRQAAKKPRSRPATRTSKSRARPKASVNAMVQHPVKALKREEPQTLAKMAMAAIAPQLVKGGLRFVARHPIVAIGGVILAGAALLAAAPEDEA